MVEEIERREGDYLDLCSRLIQIPSDNPPGTTTDIARFIASFLQDKSVTTTIHEPKKGNPNIVAALSGRQAEGGRSLILNGHLDTFPAGDPSLWRAGPYSGEIKNGQIFGRGAADMKGGVAALLGVFTLFHEMAVPLVNPLVLTLVSDEETGGRWGTKWLLENVPETRGDAVLSAEPSSTATIHLGGKGICRFHFTCSGRSEHSAYGSGDNAILKMSQLISELMTLDGLRVSPPAELKDVIEESRRYIEGLPEGKGKSGSIDRLVVNVGTIKGGLKRNLVAPLCQAEVDIRIPLGISADEVERKVRNMVDKFGVDGCTFDLFSTEPSCTPPEAQIVQLMRKNAKSQIGVEPKSAINPGQYDTRYWHSRGIPAIAYGPRRHNIGAPDEYITVKDLMDVIKVYACTIIDFLEVE